MDLADQMEIDSSMYSFDVASSNLLLKNRSWGHKIQWDQKCDLSHSMFAKGYSDVQ